MSQTVDQQSLKLSEYRQLNIDERMRLAQDIWDSIAAECVPSRDMPVQHKKELDRRYEQLLNDGEQGRSWEEVRQRVLDRRCQRTP